MNENDRSLIRQMIVAGRFNNDIYELLCEYNKQSVKEIIKKMGNKWCCHPDNAVKRLETPLPVLSDKSSKILRRKT